MLTGLGFFVGVAVVVLKLLGVAPFEDWPWWLVTLPAWGGVAVHAVVVLVTVIVARLGGSGR